MHFYTHNIGEFAALTRMMTLDEIGLTMVLIDEYVRTEKPITSETVAMYADSLATRERSDSESLASRYEKRVLRRVFAETDEGWVCPVIEEQLKKYAARAEVNRANARKPRKKQEVLGPRATEQEPQRIASESLATNNQEPITNKEKRKEIKENAAPSAAPRSRSKKFEPEELRTGQIDRHLFADWLAVRKAKRAPLTETAWSQVRREAGKAGISLDAALRLMVEHSWQGISADWEAVQAAAGKAPPVQSNRSGFMSPQTELLPTDAERHAWDAKIAGDQQGRDPVAWARQTLANPAGAWIANKARAVLAKRGLTA